MRPGQGTPFHRSERYPPIGQPETRTQPLHPDHVSALALLRAVGKQNPEGSPRARPRSDAEQAVVEVALELALARLVPHTPARRGTCLAQRSSRGSPASGHDASRARTPTAGFDA